MTFLFQFEKWSDEQRRIILEDLFGQSRPRQLTYARNLLTKKFPSYHQDFTRLFPRVLCLYIFSFLDPRSLSRCAQVRSIRCFFLLKKRIFFV